MGIPKITHLQFLILEFLSDKKQCGHYLREKLAEYGEEKSGPTFYQMMSRLENNNLVEGKYEQKIVSGQRIKERWYQITDTGICARKSVCDFYQSLGKRL